MTVRDELDILFRVYCLSSRRTVILKSGECWSNVVRLCPRRARRPLNLRGGWLWPNFLNLDAPLIAVLWQVLLARELAVHVKFGEPVVLALCVWLVYVADRVLDALRPLLGNWEPVRKSFYRRHLRIAAIAGL